MPATFDRIECPRPRGQVSSSSHPAGMCPNTCSSGLGHKGVGYRFGPAFPLIPTRSYRNGSPGRPSTKCQ